MARKRLGDSAGWDVQAELTATNADLLQNVLRVLVAQGGAEPPTFTPVPRPYQTASEAEPAETVGLAEFAEFLKG